MSLNLCCKRMPRIVGDAPAKAYFTEQGTGIEMFFTEPVFYSVECPVCGRETDDAYPEIWQAVEMWNKGFVRKRIVRRAPDP